MRHRYCTSFCSSYAGLHGSPLHLLHKDPMCINTIVLRIFSLYTQCVIGIALHFVRRLVVFMGLRCIQGVFIQGLQCVTYSMVLELFSRKYRWVKNSFDFFFRRHYGVKGQLIWKGLFGVVVWTKNPTIKDCCPSL